MNSANSSDDIRIVGGFDWGRVRQTSWRRCGRIAARRIAGVGVSLGLPQ